MQALILAGGLGTRLRTIVNDRPKPMVILHNQLRGAGKPFLEYQLEFLKSYQIVHFIFCIGYLHQHIQEYFGDGSRWGVKIDYSIEEELLGTGGAIKHAEKYVNGTFLTLNGDSFFDMSLRELIQFHESKKTQVERGNYVGSIALTRVQDAQNYGSVRLDSEKRILNFTEKSASSNGSKEINAGIYILEPEILDFIPPFKKISIEKEVFPSVLNSGRYLGGHLAKGFFVDIGTPAGYHRLQNYLKEKGL